MNKEQLGSMWREFSATPPARILKLILEAVLQAKPDQDLCQVDQEILIEDKSKGDKIIC